MAVSAFTIKVTGTVAAVLAGGVLAGIAGLPVSAQAAGAGHPGAGQRRPAVVAVPLGRQWAGFAYDAARREFVLFGGDDDARVFGDTWIREHGIWIRQHPARSPSPRTGAAVVYDAATRQLLLFGGSTGTESGFQAGTWLWTGATWRLLHPAASPPARHNADMVYDAARREVLLFGGYDGSYLGDKWTWNGTTWTRLHPAAAPSPRDSESLAYDQATSTAILFGGFSTSTGRLADTWSWNGTTWTPLTPAASPPVITTAWQAGYDPATRQVLIYGGDPGNGNSMAYDTASHRLLFFGGYGNTPTISFPTITTRWDGTRWRHAS